MNHIADFLKFAQLFWFSLDTSYGHGRHLANQSRLEPNKYEVALPLVAPPWCRLVVPAGCCIALSSPHCATLLLFCRASWLWYCLSLSSHCTALLSSCPTSWLPHCLSPSSHCATLSTTRCTSLLLHRLSSSSRCAPCCPLTLSFRRVVVVLPLDAPPSRRLVVSSCRLLLSRRSSWLSHHHLSSSSRCTALSSSHCAGWLLHCLSLRCPLILSS